VNDPMQIRELLNGVGGGEARPSPLSLSVVLWWRVAASWTYTA